MYKLKTLIFPIAILALSVFLHIFWQESPAQLLFFVPLLIGIAVIATNNEEPINLMAWYHNRLRIKAIKEGKKAINHILWSVIYSFLCFVPFIWFCNLWLVASVLFLHLSVFPVCYNLFAGVSTFNLSHTTDSWIDKLMVRIGLKSTLWVNVGAQIISLILFRISL